MKRYFTIGYGGAAYALFLVVFLYLVGFVGGIVLPRTVDHGITAPLGRRSRSTWRCLPCSASSTASWRDRGSSGGGRDSSPLPIERSTYVWLSNAALLLLYWQWRTMPAVIWHVELPAGRLAVWVLFWLGWATALTSTFLINHFDLFGLRQVYLAARKSPTPTSISTPGCCIGWCVTRSCSVS